VTTKPEFLAPVDRRARIVIDDLPKIGAPATRALESAGYTHLTELAQISESELLSLHGVGPKAIRLIRAALAERGLSLRER
jgi:DNA-directed RNA polymerase alpha subunit